MKIKEIRLPPPFLLLYEPPSPKHSALAFDPRLTHIQPTLSLYHELTFSHDPRPPPPPIIPLKTAPPHLHINTLIEPQHPIPLEQPVHALGQLREERLADAVAAAVKHGRRRQGPSLRCLRLRLLFAGPVDHESQAVGFDGVDEGGDHFLWGGRGDG